MSEQPDLLTRKELAAWMRVSVKFLKRNERRLCLAAYRVRVGKNTLFYRALEAKKVLRALGYP